MASGGGAVGDTEQMLPKPGGAQAWMPRRIEMPHIQGLRLMCMVRERAPPLAQRAVSAAALA